MFTELSTTSSTPTRRVPSIAQRGGTVGLELQSALKFGLAVALCAVAVWVTMPTASAALLIVAAVVMAARSLLVLAHDPSSPRSVRPREHATWDGALAAVLAITAVSIAIAGDTAGAWATAAGAFTLALLRLRTRYVL